MRGSVLKVVFPLSEMRADFGKPTVYSASLFKSFSVRGARFAMKIINLLTLIAPLCVLADLTDHEASEGGMFGRIAQVQISSPKDVGAAFPDGA